MFRFGQTWGYELDRTNRAIENDNGRSGGGVVRFTLLYPWITSQTKSNGNGRSGGGVVRFTPLADNFGTKKNGKSRE